MAERATGSAAGKRLRITWVKSTIGYRQNQHKNITSLGLRRLHQTVEHYDTPTIRGMIGKVSHLVRVEEVPEGTPPPPARETGAQRFAARMAKKQAAREAFAAALFGEPEAESDGAAGESLRERAGAAGEATGAAIGAAAERVGDAIEAARERIEESTESERRG